MTPFGGIETGGSLGTRAGVLGAIALAQTI
jgi:hypothetical protein